MHPKYTGLVWKPGECTSQSSHLQQGPLTKVPSGSFLCNPSTVYVTTMLSTCCFQLITEFGGMIKVGPPLKNVELLCPLSFIPRFWFPCQTFLWLQHNQGHVLPNLQPSSFHLGSDLHCSPTALPSFLTPFMFLSGRHAL